MGLMKIGKSLIGTMFTAPETSEYPRGGLVLPESARGYLLIEDALCTLCGVCGRRCPAGAIRTDRAEEKLYIDRMKCIACEECIDECPENCLSMTGEYIAPEESVVVDVFNVKAVPGSDAVLREIESPMNEIVFPEALRKSMLRTREVQRLKRRNRNTAERRKNRTFTKYRNKR